MDDELKAIQDELDNVLERLAAYMGSDKLNTNFVKWDSATKEDAAAVIFSYAGAHTTVHTPMDIASVIHRFRLDRAEIYSKEDEYLDAFGDEVGGLVSAINALSASGTVPDSYHLNNLSLASSDFMDGRAKWFGESQGLPLVTTRRKGEAVKPPLFIAGYLDKEKHFKLMASIEVYFLHRDKGIPIDDGLFELVAEQMSIKPGLLKAFYYSDEAKDFRHAHEIVEDINGKPIGAPSINPHE